MVEDKLLRCPRGENTFPICFHLFLDLVWDLCCERRGVAQDLCEGFRSSNDRRYGFSSTHEGDVELHEDIKYGPYTLGVS